MSGISSGASGLNRAIAGYTEKIQIGLCLLYKGAWLQTSESGSATEIYYWLRVKRVGLRRLAACDLKRSLRTFKTRAGVSSTSHNVFCSSFYRRLRVAIQTILSQKALSLSVALWFQPFNLSILVCHSSFIVCYVIRVFGCASSRLPDSGNLLRSLLKAWDRGYIKANLQFAPL